jgi:hypothetical protein
MVGRPLTLDIGVFSGHPTVPIGLGLTAISFEATLKAYLAWGLDPDRISEIRSESLLSMDTRIS